MGWTETPLGSGGLAYAQAEHLSRMSYTTRDRKERHVVAQIERAGKPLSGTIYAIVRIVDNATREIKGHYLRVDLWESDLDTFSVKEGTEDCGVYTTDKPSPEFIAMVEECIPVAEGFARSFRDRMGIGYRGKGE